MGHWRSATKRAIYERDGHECVYCRNPVRIWQARFALDEAPCDAATVDHLIPGRGHQYPNVVTACHACNSQKGARSAREFLEGVYPPEDAEARLKYVRSQRKRGYKRIANRIRFDDKVEEEIQRRIDLGLLRRVDAEPPDTWNEFDPPF